MGSGFQVGDKVTTFAGSIDRNQHKGAIGVVQGFARLSSYHPREVFVAFDDGRGGWFWEHSVRPAPQPLTRTERFTGDYQSSFAA